MPEVRCPLCGGAEATVLLAGLEEALQSSELGPSRSRVSPGRVLRCGSCGLGFRQTRPGEEELSRLYGALDKKLYEAEAHGRARTAERQLAIIRKFVPGGRLLDVGCASGAFLQVATGQGWDVTGVEPSRELYEIAASKLAGKGRLICATLQEAKLPPASFDVLTLWDVLEHVPDPQGFLLQCAGLIRKGGFLFLNVPDLDSLPARVLGSRWPLFLPEHLNYFHRHSLRLCGEKANLAWKAFGRRWASFSLEYVLYRLGQHMIPGASWAHGLSPRALGRLVVRIPLGEIWGAWQAR